LRTTDLDARRSASIIMQCAFRLTFLFSCIVFASYVLQLSAGSVYYCNICYVAGEQHTAVTVKGIYFMPQRSRDEQTYFLLL